MSWSKTTVTSEVPALLKYPLSIGAGAAQMGCSKQEDWTGKWKKEEDWRGKKKETGRDEKVRKDKLALFL